MTVDDDSEVLGAIERDLRAHYASDYRIVKACSPGEAMQAAQQLKTRGMSVALFLVDQRMPGMSGTELLAELKKLFPESVKVLLTAYADTEAAIKSINEIDLDHYLLKPWDPPSERLYPVLDDLLSKWSTKVRLPFDGIRLVGAQSSAESFRAKEFLARNLVPYQWIDIDRDPSIKELIMKLGADDGHLPVVLLPDGSHLVSPDLNVLAEKVGLQTKPKAPFYDLVVVGSGPAGLAVALYGGSEGLRVVMVEQSAPGGQAATSSRIENYLGFPSGITGADLAQRAVAQARRFGVEFLTASVAVGLRREDPYRIVTLRDGSEIPAYAVIFTTGMSVKRLDVPGVEQLQGIGVYYGAAMTEGATYRDQHVCIVGGANSAGQGAMFFARYARKVTMLVRAPALSPAMSQYLVDRINGTKNIEVITKVDVAEVRGNGRLDSVVLRNVLTGGLTELGCAAMFIFIGAKPSTDMVQGVLATDEQGFVLTGADLPRLNGRPRGWNLDRDPFLFETSIPGVFAAGDVRSGANRRVAAAVGEGSASIFTIHKYLQTV